MALRKYPRLNPLKDLEPKEVADSVDALRDQGRTTYDNDDGSVVFKEKRVILRNITVPMGQNSCELLVHEHLRFADFENVGLGWTQKGGSKSYVPRIDQASPTRFIIKIDDHDEDVTYSRLEIKGS